MKAPEVPATSTAEASEFKSLLFTKINLVFQNSWITNSMTISLVSGEFTEKLSSDLMVLTKFTARIMLQKSIAEKNEL